MRLLRIPQPFDHPDFIYELKLDGFRGLAVVSHGTCQLVSRNGYVFTQWDALAGAIARSIGARSAVLDGEIACFGADGRTDFYGLMFRRREPRFAAFDLLELDGRDLRSRPLLERKRRLRALMPAVQGRLQYVDHIEERGTDFYKLACAKDLEGVVAKWAHGRYQTGHETSWLKIKNPTYSQMEGRHELFEARRSTFEGRSRQQTTTLALR